MMPSTARQWFDCKPREGPLVCAMRTASRLNSSLCIAAISGLLDGEYCSQKTGTKPRQVQVAEFQIRVAVLNGFTALGIPVTEAVG